MVFSNTTPFISLSSVQLLHLLPSIFGEVSVAASVVEECSEGGRIVASRLKQEKVPRLVFPLAGGNHAVGQCVLFERQAMV